MLRSTEKTVAQGIQTGFLPGEHFARHRQGIGNGAAEFLDGRQPHPAELHIEEAHIEFGIVDNQFRTAQKIGNLPADLCKRRRVFLFQNLYRQAVDACRLFGHIALGVDIEVQVFVGHLAVDHFQTGKLDQTVAAVGIQAGGFGIEDDLACHHIGVFLLSS